MWLRVRVEGSTLKVVITEKVNPPVKDEDKYGNLVADMDGQIKRIYTYSGRAVVKNDDIVKKGAVVIEGIDGNEGGEYVVRPSGMVIANTFYEKQSDITSDKKSQGSAERGKNYGFKELLNRGTAHWNSDK